jgi:hypothetical protein
LFPINVCAMIFLDERFRAHRCNYRYSDSRCSVTHDRASRWALGWINKLDRWGKNSYIRIDLKNKSIEQECQLGYQLVIWRRLTK